MKKQIITGAIIVAVIFVLALPKIGWFSDNRSDGGDAQGSPGPQRTPLLPVEAMVMRPRHLDNRLIVTGSILANESLELKSEISGKITGIAFEEGSRVKKGS